MPRIIYHLDFLLANPDIKIMVSRLTVADPECESTECTVTQLLIPLRCQVGCDSKKTVAATAQGLKHMLLSMRPMMDLAGAVLCCAALRCER
jgi:hypothetical protein